MKITPRISPKEELNDFTIDLFFLLQSRPFQEGTAAHFPTFLSFAVENEFNNLMLSLRVIQINGKGQNFYQPKAFLSDKLDVFQRLTVVRKDGRVSLYFNREFIKSFSEDVTIKTEGYWVLGQEQDGFGIIP